MLSLQQLSHKAASLDEEIGTRWCKVALDALVDDNAYALQVAFGMEEADIRTKVVGYSRYGRYGRTSLKEYTAIPHRPPGDTILHLAVRNKRPYAVAKLLALGANPVTQNGLGESALDVANSDPEMKVVFRGLIIDLPTGDRLVYEDHKLQHIQSIIKHDSMEEQVRQVESKMREADSNNKNHLRARDHAESKLKLVRTDYEDCEQRRKIAVEGRLDMQTKRDKAEGARKLMKTQLEQLYAEKVHWAKIEQRAIQMERERDQEIRKRERVEDELQLAYAHINKLERQKQEVLQARAATEERMKDALGSCLATTISVKAQSSVKLANMVAERRQLGPAAETIFREEDQ